MIKNLMVRGVDKIGTFFDDGILLKLLRLF